VEDIAINLESKLTIISKHINVKDTTVANTQCSTNVLPYVLHILKGAAMTRDYSSLSPWSAMPESYPWAKDIPKE